MQQTNKNDTQQTITCIDMWNLVRIFIHELIEKWKKELLNKIWRNNENLSKNNNLKLELLSSTKTHNSIWIWKRKEFSFLIPQPQQIYLSILDVSPTSTSM